MKRAPLTATGFHTAMHRHGFRFAGGEIVCDDVPGKSWLLLIDAQGRIDYPKTLLKIVRERRREILRQVRQGTV
jgi:hypothetical protein